MTAAPPLPPATAWRGLVARALEEDLGPGDVTTPLVVPASAHGEGTLVARAPLVVCGLAVAAAVFEAVDPGLRIDVLAGDGAPVPSGTPLLRAAGTLRALLAAERTALNFVARLAGVATWTRRFVDAVAGTGAAIVDTRKTLPGWRALDKYATAVGGAVNHRAGLFDGILLKDNHLAAAGGAAAAVRAARRAAPPHLRIQVEVESEAEAEDAVAEGADALLLDNRTLEELRRLAARFAKTVLLEASGGVTLDSVRAIAETGVPRISVGALTHSAPAADVAFDLVPSGPRA